MDKKFILKTCVLLFAVLFPVLASATDSSNYPNPNVYLRDESGLTAVWNKDLDDGTCWICHPGDYMDYPEPSYQGKVVIPEYILGRRVVGIQRDAFKDNENITEIVISGTVREIERHAFDGCSGLRVLSFLHGDSAINIGAGGDANQAGALVYSGIDSLYVDRELEFTSQRGPFEKSALRVISIGPNVTKIGKMTFYGIPALKKIVIPANCMEFGLNCFQYTSIEEVVIESSGELLNTGGWRDSSMYNPSNKPFSSCGIKRLYIDRPITGLGGTSKLEELYLGPNAGALSFQNCRSLVKADIACVELPKNAFMGCEALKELTLREGVVTLGANCFSGCSSLETVRLPDSYVATAKSSGAVFNKCTNLKSVENLNISYVPQNMFAYCASLQKITFGEKVDSIGNGAFGSCLGLKHVTIPSNVEFIGYVPFAACDSIEKFIIEDGAEYKLTSRFWDKTVKYVYFGRQINYKPNDWRNVGYSPFANGQVGEAAEFGPMVRTIGFSYFRNCQNLRDVIIGPGVELIETFAFRECGALEEIRIPSNVREIQENAFMNCRALTKVAFGGETSPVSRSGVACVIAKNAFNGCGAIADVEIVGDVMPALEAGAFHNDVYANATLTVPEGMAADYMAHPEWGRFNTITENITTGIGESVVSEPDVCDVFSLQGVEVLRNVDNAALNRLAPGIYIVRSRACVRKIVKK